jgi:dihydrofolate reductase
MAAAVGSQAFQGGNARHTGDHGPQDLSFHRPASAGSRQHRGFTLRFSADGVETVESLEAAIELARSHAAQTGASQVSVIGGGQIYAQAIGVADELLLTEVDAEIEGDTVFPEIDSALWQKVSLSGPVKTEKDSHTVRFAVWQRQNR